MSEIIFPQKIAVLGAGSWGTALAIHLAKYQQPVCLWEYDLQQVALMQKTHCNERYLSGIQFPSYIQVEGDLSKAVTNVQDILLAIPSHAFRQTLMAIKPYVTDQTRLISATKGIDPKTNQLFHETIQEILGDRCVAVLSGPSFAKEVAQGLPTVVTMATHDDGFARELVARFNHGHFRVYLSHDLMGVQLGGAVKNVIAIAAGASDGLGFGANAKSALITRGLAEIIRLGLAMGAEQATFMGLSGVGDLVLTCTDDQSRNRRLGLALARGKTAAEAEKDLGQVAEGSHTARQVIALAKQYHVEMPICEQVYRILQNELSPQQAVAELLARKPKAEF